MKFSILIKQSPTASQAPLSAFRFASALLEQGHEVYRLFLQGEGVLLAASPVVYPADENNIHLMWRDLIAKYQLDAVVCVSSAIKRGIYDEQEAKRHNASANLADGYVISGLGQLMDATIHSDRVVSFG